jgi:hypothetical protein
MGKRSPQQKNRQEDIPLTVEAVTLFVFTLETLEKTQV